MDGVIIVNAYVEANQVVIQVQFTPNIGTNDFVAFQIIPTAYHPRTVIGGTYFAASSDADSSKISHVYLTGNGGCIAKFNGKLSADEYASFVYPVRLS